MANISLHNTAHFTFFFLFRLQHWFFFCFLLYLAIRDKAPFFSSHSPVQGANPPDHRMLVFFMHQWKKHNVAGATRVVCGSCEHVGCVIAASHPRQDTTPSSPVASIYICIRDSGFWTSGKQMGHRRHIYMPQHARERERDSVRHRGLCHVWLCQLHNSKIIIIIKSHSKFSKCVDCTIAIASQTLVATNRRKWRLFTISRMCRMLMCVCRRLIQCGPDVSPVRLVHCLCEWLCDWRWGRDGARAKTQSQSRFSSRVLHATLPSLHLSSSPPPLTLCCRIVQFIREPP